MVVNPEANQIAQPTRVREWCLWVRSLLSSGQATSADRVEGLIERVTYFNEDSGFCVLRVKASGHRDVVTVIGTLPSVSPGEWITAEGTWFRDKEYGLQLKATTLRTVAPTTAEGIEKYLGSGMVKGIGPIFAKRLVERFGAEVLAVIEHKAADLQLVDGIGPKRRQRITGAWEARASGSGRSCCSCIATASVRAAPSGFTRR